MCGYKFSCKQPAGREKAAHRIIQQFRVPFSIVILFCFYYEKIFGIFESFVLRVMYVFASHTDGANIHRKSIFSTPNDDGKRQWDGKKWKNFHYALFSIMNRRFFLLDLVLHFRKFTMTVRESPSERFYFVL
jgi:hypothetical protein